MSTFLASNGSLQFVLAAAETNDITWNSTVVAQSGGWTEKGSLTFGTSGGDVSSITFAGTGTIVPTSVPGLATGGITYTILSGTGVFAGAQGLIVDSFRSYAHQAWFLISAWGTIYVPI
eukprot:c16311_g1_i1.p3 GENE.c16311_g1_i1~~c16311_g1_i1.p3  ORF type:complete len:119 (+),score=20.10 c16311_g1_i1:237-593(+)